MNEAEMKNYQHGKRKLKKTVLPMKKL